MNKILSIITPCFNEEESVEVCYKTVKDIMNKLENIEYEHIFSDNSSTDSTVQILESIASSDKNVKILVNSHNVGPFKNNFNALKYASGDYILVFLPADLQDPPELIPELLSLLESGYEIALGIRKTRMEHILLKFLRRSFYVLMNLFSDHKVLVGAGEFMMITKKVNGIIINSKNYKPYIRGLVAQLNFPKATIDYVWKKREFGKSKNSYSDLVNQALNALVTMAFKPIRFFVYFGTGSIITGLVLLILSVFDVELGLTIFNIIVIIFLSIIIFAIGLLGEYVLNINSKINENLELQVIKKINF